MTERSPGWTGRAAMKTAPARVAVLGYGLAAANFHGPMLAAVPGFDVCWVVTSHPDRRRRAAAHFPDASILNSAPELWDLADRPDLVVVATPPVTHAPLAARAIELGISVVVDKPATVSAPELEDLISMAQSRDVVLSVFHNRRWDGDFRTVRQVIKSGVLGKLVRFESSWEVLQPMDRTSWKSSTSRRDGGGALYSIGPHLIDQAIILFGDPVSCHAELASGAGPADADADAFLSLEFRDGPRVHLSMSLMAHAPAPRFRVQGSEGAYVDPNDDPLKLAGELAAAGCLIRSAAASARNSEPVELLAAQPGHYYTQLLAALRGEAPIPVPAEEAVATMRVIDQATGRGG
jgi:scyllo-inositol 2-dehydrogenase (NADP+)